MFNSDEYDIQLLNTEDVETTEVEETIVSATHAEETELVETEITSEIVTDVTDSEIIQNLNNINEGLQLISGLLLFFFVWSIFNWLYNFFKSFF
jgi:uncharacterized membrane protein YjjP (DUF1212 family)